MYRCVHRKRSAPRGKRYKSYDCKARFSFSAHAPPNACPFTAATYRTPTHRQPPCSQNFPLTPGCVLSAVSPWVPPSTGESSCHLASSYTEVNETVLNTKDTQH
ncbi:unnamed protein product [Dicrocoelium dendriticum]|nr:unnamed protein product [Dicrocoelium dendriticum]